MHSRSVFFLALSLFASVAACGSESSNNTNSDAGTGTDTGSKTDTGAVEDAPPPAPCSEPVEERPAGSQCVKTVTGKAVDTTGAPLPAHKLVSVCGQVCYFGETAADGTFTANIGKFIKVANFAASVHGRPDPSTPTVGAYASLYEKLPASTADNIVLPTLVLPKLGPSTAKLPLDDKGVVTAATNLTDGDVTLNIAANTEVEIDLEDVALGEDGKLFRAVKIESKDYPSFAKDANVVLLWAATPFDAKFKTKVGLTINATGGLAEGAAVEIIALGNDFLREPFTAGKLQVVATGKVTGGKIVTDAGQGLDYLTWFGVRAK